MFYSACFRVKLASARVHLSCSRVLLFSTDTELLLFIVPLQHEALCPFVFIQLPFCASSPECQSFTGLYSTPTPPFQSVATVILRKNIKYIDQWWVNPLYYYILIGASGSQTFSSSWDSVSTPTEDEITVTHDFEERRRF